MTPSALAQRIVDAASKTPDAVAIDDIDGSSLTYGQLLEAVDRVGGVLAAGLEPGGVIALLRERDITQVLAFVACVRFGLPVVVLDPVVPPRRLQSILGQLPGGQVVAANGGDPATEVLGPGWELARLDPDASTGSATSQAVHDAVVIIATSGSTGRPKLVMLEHDALENRMVWACEEFGLTSEDVFIYSAAVGFDFGLFEMLCPLVLGARLVIPDRDAHRDAEALVEAVRKAGVTVVHGSPSLLRQVHSFLDDGGCLRLIFSGGEALSAELADALSAATGVEVVNEYGPTETTIDSLAHRFRPGVNGQRFVPIGTPIRRTHVRIDRPDERGRGELIIGGAGVARGYFADPRATAAAFRPDPHPEAPRGGRVYHTGDLVSADEDGTFHFHGRGDDQIKVRGVRIELAEVRAAYERHPLVLEVVAGGFPTAEGTRLAVTVEVADDSVPVTELRRFASTYLPRSMQPDILDAVESLPRLANGKVDHQAIQSTWADQVDRGVSHADAGVPASEGSSGGVLGVLLDVVREELGLEDVAATDNFFVLGGHSLLAGQVVSVVRARTGVRIPLRVFFNAESFGDMFDSSGKVAPRVR